MTGVSRHEDPSIPRRQKEMVGIQRGSEAEIANGGGGVSQRT